MIRLSSGFLAILTIAATFAGCSASPPVLTGLWNATEVAGQAVAGPTFEVIGDKVSGTAGCNRYNGPIKMDGMKVKIGPLITTRMFCDGKMEVETAYLAGLQSAETYVIASDGLSLIDAGGSAAVKFSR